MRSYFLQRRPRNPGSVYVIYYIDDMENSAIAKRHVVEEFSSQEEAIVRVCELRKAEHEKSVKE